MRAKFSTQDTFKPVFHPDENSLKDVNYKGLYYDFASNTLGVVVTNEATEDSEVVITSGGVYDAIASALQKVSEEIQNELANALLDYYTQEEIVDLLESKVDKVDGKGLSTNDYTNADMIALTTFDQQLIRKVDKQTGWGLSENNFTSAEKSSLAKWDVNNYYTKTQIDEMLNELKGD